MMVEPELEGCIQVTAAWVFMHVCKTMLMGTANNLVPGCSEKHKMWAGRTFLNFLEQAPGFLSGLWVHAVTFDPALSASMGRAYIVFAAMYPVARLWGGDMLVLSTIPRYGINTFFACSVLLKLGLGVDLHNYCHGTWTAASAIAIGFLISLLPLFTNITINTYLKNSSCFGRDNKED